jgi:hypothetical protein
VKSQFSLRKRDLTMNSKAVHVPCSKNYHIKYYTGSRLSDATQYDTFL